MLVGVRHCGPKVPFSWVTGLCVQHVVEVDIHICTFRPRVKAKKLRTRKSIWFIRSLKYGRRRSSWTVDVAAFPDRGRPSDGAIAADGAAHVARICGPGKILQRGAELRIHRAGGCHEPKAFDLRHKRRRQLAESRRSCWHAMRHRRGRWVAPTSRRMRCSCCTMMRPC